LHVPSRRRPREMWEEALNFSRKRIDAGNRAATRKESSRDAAAD
jgi:hypothetical protein